jgi:hypothetical protein
LRQRPLIVLATSDYHRLAKRSATAASLPRNRDAFERDAKGNMAAKPEHHVRFKHRRQTCFTEEIDQSLLTVLAFLPWVDGWFDLAVTVHSGHHGRHAKRAPITAYGFLGDVRSVRFLEIWSSLAGTARFDTSRAWAKSGYGDSFLNSASVLRPAGAGWV